MTEFGTKSTMASTLLLSHLMDVRMLRDYGVLRHLLQCYVCLLGNEEELCRLHYIMTMYWYSMPQHLTIWRAGTWYGVYTKSHRDSQKSDVRQSMIMELANTKNINQNVCSTVVCFFFCIKKGRLLSKQKLNNWAPI